MYINIHMHIYIYIYTYIHTCIHTYTYRPAQGPPRPGRRIGALAFKFRV